MDDQTGTPTATKAVLAVLSFVVLALAARAVFGDLGVQVVVVVAMLAVAAYAWTGLSGRPLPRLALPPRSVPEPAPAVEDVWRSERWIAEAVARGLRALDDWRLEQREV